MGVEGGTGGKGRRGCQRGLEGVRGGGKGRGLDGEKRLVDIVHV